MARLLAPSPARKLIVSAVLSSILLGPTNSQRGMIQLRHGQCCSSGCGLGGPADPGGGIVPVGGWPCWGWGRGLESPPGGNPPPPRPPLILTGNFRPREGGAGFPPRAPRCKTPPPLAPPFLDAIRARY